MRTDSYIYIFINQWIERGKRSRMQTYTENRILGDSVQAIITAYNTRVHVYMRESYVGSGIWPCEKKTSMEKLNNFVAKDLSLSDQGDTIYTSVYTVVKKTISKKGHIYT